MPWRRAQLTQGRHPFEVLFLVLCAAAGLVGLVVPPDRVTVLQQILGDHAWVWYAGLLLASAAALAGVLLRPPTCLFVERAAMLLLAPLFFVYGAALLLIVGLGASAVPTVFCLGGCAAAVARVSQISKAVRLAKTLTPDELDQIVGARRPWRGVPR